MEPPRVLVLGRALVAPGEHQPQEPSGVELPGRRSLSNAHAPGAAMDASSTWRENVASMRRLLRRRPGPSGALQLPVPREVRGPVLAHASRATQRAWSRRGRSATSPPLKASSEEELPRTLVILRNLRKTTWARCCCLGEVDARERAGRHQRLGRARTRARTRRRRRDPASPSFLPSLPAPNPEPANPGFRKCDRPALVPIARNTSLRSPARRNVSVVPNVSRGFRRLAASRNALRDARAPSDRDWDAPSAATAMFWDGARFESPGPDVPGDATPPRGRLRRRRARPARRRLFAIFAGSERRRLGEERSSASEPPAAPPPPAARNAARASRAAAADVCGHRTRAATVSASARDRGFAATHASASASARSSSATPRSSRPMVAANASAGKAASASGSASATFRARLRAHRETDASACPQSLR